MKKISSLKKKVLLLQFVMLYEHSFNMTYVIYLLYVYLIHVAVLSQNHFLFEKLLILCTFKTLSNKINPYDFIILKLIQVLLHSWAFSEVYKVGILTYVYIFILLFSLHERHQHRLLTYQYIVSTPTNVIKFIRAIFNFFTKNI